MRHKDKGSIFEKFIFHFLPIVVIFIVVFLSYSNLIALPPHNNPTHIIKWDIVDFMYLRLVFNSDSIRNLVFPLWNPYVYGGVPYISNPQTSLFHPINLIIILLKGYSLQLLQFQLIITFFFAGLSMYFCLRGFYSSRISSLLGAISFSTCGFFVGNAEHFQHINVLAFFPLSLLAVNRVVDKSNILTTSIWMLTIPLIAFCGYPTMLVFCLYILFIFGVMKIFFFGQQHKPEIMFKKFFHLASFFILGILASSVLLLPAFEHVSLSTRGLGAPLDSIKDNSLPLIYCADIWYPFLALKNISSLHIDITLRNCSIGIIGLFFLIYFIFFNKTKLKILFLLLLTFSFMLALGMNTPVYFYIFKVLPFIKQVRHPALDFRAFFLFFLCLCAGFGCDDLLRNKDRAIFKNFIVFSILVFSGVLIGFKLKSSYNLNVFSMVDTYYPFLYLSILFLIFIVLAGRKIATKLGCIVLMAFVILDVSHWVNVNFFTVADKADNQVWDNIKHREADRNKKVDRNTNFKRKGGNYPVSLDDNFAMFYKYFSNSGYDPLILNYYDEFIKSPSAAIITEDFRILPIYEMKLLPDEKSVLEEINKDVDLHKIALINKEDLRDKRLMEKVKGLAITVNDDFEGKIVHYEPNRISYSIKSGSPVVIFFNEIYYPGWSLSSNGKRMHLFRMNHAFRGAYLEPGVYNLRMTFFPNSFKIGIVISILTCLFLILSVMQSRRANLAKKDKKALKEGRDAQGSKM